MRKTSVRRGISAVQWTVVAAVITLVIVASVTLIGSRTNTKLNQTATDVASPSSLKQRFSTSK